MKKKVAVALAAVLSAGSVSASQAKRPVEFTVGSGYYRETYREYTNGTDRLMQERGNLWSLEGGIKYPFNDRHAAKIEGRYSHGKSDYTGQYMEDSYYGEAVVKSIPRRAYDIRASYEHTHPLNEKLDLVLETGLGHRILKDLGSRANQYNYDRKNQILYARAGAGLNIKLPGSFEISPKAAYNHMLHGRQYSYHSSYPGKFKQSGGRGIEVEVPVSKRFSNDSKLSFGPFYRGWKVPDSERIYSVDSDGRLWSVREPKNYTHEAGMKLQYSF
ncbi:porin family protein [Neisseria sp.]|uniref:porin family protein n=1 Tax=Neisseria sp. TaxID=192066 RepID=UPI0026DB1A18|nr:porin family protein [Neisseria sp.]MDO4906530.1 porin family protein [Neisseria sp.]